MFYVDENWEYGVFVFVVLYCVCEVVEVCFEFLVYFGVVCVEVDVFVMCV